MISISYEHYKCEEGSEELLAPPSRMSTILVT